MPVHSNPYIAGNPVRGQTHFVGRTDILRDVLRLLRNPNANAIALYGQRRIGKTSILFQLEHQLAESGKYLPVYFDLHDKADLSLAQILYRLAGQIARYIDVPHLNRDDFDAEGTYFHSVFLPDAIRQTHKQLILLFDEFDVLDRPYKGQVGATFLPYLKRWIVGAYQVHFVLAMGRRPEDLSARMLSAFKQVQSHHVTLMDLPESLAIVRLSEQNQTLFWSDGGINRVCYWTQGHPYLTQLLCSEVWEAAYDGNPAEPPTAEAEDVDIAVDATLEQGANAFQWIWNGLPPAEKVLLAAMAGSGNLCVLEDQLGVLLKQKGVDLNQRELLSALVRLGRWDLLRRDGCGYRFSIPLLQRWIAENRPLRRVKMELDNIEPMADNLYMDAEEKYARGDLGETERLLRRTLAINPRHVPAQLLLGQVHLNKGNPAEAVAAMESVYALEPAAAQDGLLAALLAYMMTQQDEDEQWQTVSRILRLKPNLLPAKAKRDEILRRWASRAAEGKDYQAALNAYEQLDNKTGTAGARTRLRLQSFTKRLLSGSEPTK